ncbi:MAG: 6-phospho-beta-glucosidase, partial [Defluviitaleaceae bacterium]|nr:6-phospho-beta-glucosidase [Defluviitaleaceae bacterium]
PIGMANNFAKLMKADLSRLRLEIAGSNHFIFVTNVFVDGVSVFDEFMTAYLNKSEDMNMKNITGIDFSESLIKGLGAIPCTYHNYYFHQKEQVKKQLQELADNQVRGQVVKQVEEELFALYKDESLDIKPSQLEKRGGALYSDAACNLVSSIYNNTCDVQYLNVVNNGTISNLPKDCVIETACMVTANGPIPLNIGELKPEIAGYIHHIKSFERLCVKAAAEGCRDTAIAALNLNPLIGSDALAVQVFDLLLEAHKEYLPQF